MSDEKKLKDDEKKGGEFRIPPRTWIIWSAIISSILLLLLFKDRYETSSPVLNQFEFTQKVSSNLIVKAYVSCDVQNPLQSLFQISGKYYKTDAEGNKVAGTDGKP